MCARLALRGQFRDRLPRQRYSYTVRPVRTYDAELVNRIANSPGVPELLGAESFDFTAALQDPSNIFLHHEGAVAICEWSAPRVYQCHLLFDPSCRGGRAVRAAIAMRDFMLDHHADMLWGQPALENVAGRKLIRLAGFKNAGFGTFPANYPVQGETEMFTCRR